MKWIVGCLAVLSSIFTMALSPHGAPSEETSWKKVDEGLYLRELDPEPKSKINNRKITLVKIDPKFYSFRLLSASEHGRMRMTAKKWCQQHNLISAINAGMYQQDGIRNVGYMKNFNHINSPRLNTRYQAVLAFNPVESTVPDIQIIDLQCQGFQRLKDKYQTLIQGIRMVSCRQENVWERQDKMWSIAAFGMDKGGHGLFIFSESPYSVHDLTNILLSPPLSLYNAMYLEGGPEATLYFSAKGVEFEKIGSHEMGLKESGFQKIARPIPNIIGIAKKFR